MRISPILDALFPPVRTSILAATDAQPDREWYLTELARFLHTQPSSLQREVNALTKAGILQQRRDGRRVYLKADPGSPVFTDLKKLLEKTAGIVPVLQQELTPLRGRLELAFLYGSMARSEETSASDIDLLVVGEAGLADLLPALRRSEKRLGRPVNPTIYSLSEFRKKSRGHDHFLTAVLKGAKQFVTGDRHELERITGQT
jgi:predicted nucleotidyltransferase